MSDSCFAFVDIQINPLLGVGRPCVLAYMDGNSSLFIHRYV